LGRVKGAKETGRPKGESAGVGEPNTLQLFVPRAL